MTTDSNNITTTNKWKDHNNNSSCKQPTKDKTQTDKKTVNV